LPTIVAFKHAEYAVEVPGSPRHLQQLTRLSYLAPDIITTIVDGTQPVDLTGRKILRIGSVPLCWTAQRKLLGFN